MNLEIDSEQRDFVESTAELCRRLGHDGMDVRESLRQLGRVGILGVRHPEPGGIGLTIVESVLVAEECGAALAPTPALIWADLVGERVEGALEGTALVAGRFTSDNAVSYGATADVFVYECPDGARAVSAHDIEWSEVPSPDPTIPRAKSGPVPVGELIADGRTTEQWRWQARLLAASHLVGVARGAIDTSVEYARERCQFGAPIGSFQAIKHLLADAYAANELARSQVLSAAACAATDDPTSRDQATAALLVASRAAITASQTAIQVHGGMGFTWETTPHLYYKRALLLGESFGNRRELARDLVYGNLALNR